MLEILKWLNARTVWMEVLIESWYEYCRQISMQSTLADKIGQTTQSPFFDGCPQALDNRNELMSFTLITFYFRCVGSNARTLLCQS